MSRISCFTEDEHAALYESFRLRYDQAQEDLQQYFVDNTINDASSSNNSNSNENEDPKQASLLQLAAASILSSHAEMEGVFQHSVLEDSLEKDNDSREETDSKMATQLDRTLLLLESGYAMPQIDAVLARAVKRASSNEKQPKKMISQKNARSVAVDVDAFWEEYPEFDRTNEWKRQQLQQDGSSDEESSCFDSSLEDDVSAQMKQKKSNQQLQQKKEEMVIDLLEGCEEMKEIEKPQPCADKQSSVVVRSQKQPELARPSSSSIQQGNNTFFYPQPSQTLYKMPPPPPPPQIQGPSPITTLLPLPPEQPHQQSQPHRNPYTTHRPPASAPPLQLHQLPTTAIHNTATVAAPPPPPTWDDVQMNPFQTAYEFSKSNSASNSSNGANNAVPANYQHGHPVYQQQHLDQQYPLPHPPSQQQQYRQNAADPQFNPYAQQPLTTQPIRPETPVPQIKIRDSLTKNKFRRPVKTTDGCKDNDKKNRSSKGQSKPEDRNGKKNGSTSINNNNNNHRRDAGNSSSNSNEEEDEDDLPEELKRFGKDLVEKIESEIMDCGEQVTFEDIAGLADVKQTIIECVCWPIQRPDLFSGLRQAPKAVLLYGPPGTGKTLIGKAIAHESGATFFSISSSSLTSKWIGEGEKLVRTMFAVAAYRQPAVVFIDEIDSLLTQRKADENEASRRIKTEFLVQMDGTGTAVQGRVLTIGATNRPQELDEAARRRFVKRLYIPLPDEQDRLKLLHVLLKKNKHRLTDQEIAKLAKETDRFSGADLKSLCEDAAYGPVRDLSGAQFQNIGPETLKPISYKHFRQSLKGMNPSVSPKDVEQYEEFDKIFGNKRALLGGDDDDDDDDDEYLEEGQDNHEEEKMSKAN